MPGTRRTEHARVADGIAGTVEPAAEAVERDHEVLGHVGTRCHVDAGAGHRGAAPAGGEEPRRTFHQRRGNGGALLDVVGRVVGHRGAERVEPGDVGGDEVAVVEALGEDHAHHAGEQRGILARLHLEVDVGAACQLGAARIDGDDAEPAAAGVAQVLEGVGVWRAAVAREGGDAGVVADEHHDVGVGEAVDARVPRAVPTPSAARVGRSCWA